MDGLHFPVTCLREAAGVDCKRGRWDGEPSAPPSTQPSPQSYTDTLEIKVIHISRKYVVFLSIAIKYLLQRDATDLEIMGIRHASH